MNLFAKFLSIAFLIIHWCHKWFYMWNFRIILYWLFMLESNASIFLWTWCILTNVIIHRELKLCWGLACNAWLTTVKHWMAEFVFVSLFFFNLKKIMVRLWLYNINEWILHRRKIPFKYTFVVVIIYKKEGQTHISYDLAPLPFKRESVFDNCSL